MFIYKLWVDSKHASIFIKDFCMIRSVRNWMTQIVSILEYMGLLVLETWSNGFDIHKCNFFCFDLYVENLFLTINSLDPCWMDFYMQKFVYDSN